MSISVSRHVLAWLSCTLVLPMYAASATAAAPDVRRIEEVIVTAERRESSVQDTSISITAFTSEMVQEFGIRNQSDLQRMIPATTIQPYDATIRGVGRNFRNLGGDPGVAVYMNGVYSEDLYTATIGSLWDIERVEVLRGPQGTLYGRNAVGGAMNFIYKKPTDELELAAKTVLGSYGTNDYYGMVSGPLIKDTLNSRLTYSSRRHDGWVEDKGLGPDLDSGDEQNVALQFEWLINDAMHLNVRSNVARVDRVFGGADGAGLIVLAGENAVLPNDDGLRNFTARTNYVRPVDPTQTDPLDPTFVDPTRPLLTYTNPTTGTAILAQRVRPGIDPAGGGLPNYGRDVTRDPADCVFLDRDDIEGDDLCAYTNGHNREDFEQNGTQLEFTWDLGAQTTLKYIFGYNDLMYERISEDDSAASVTDDRQFYVNHEAEYVSHELQLFWDLGSKLTFTSGVFLYNSTIDQRYDFFSSTSAPQFTDPNWAMDNFLATFAPGAVPGDPALTFLAGTVPIDVHSARRAAEAAGAPLGSFTVATGPWLGDASLGTIRHGPVTPGSDLHETNKTDREAFAVYTQGVWNIAPRLALTLGVRYAYDDVVGEENLARYTETTTILDAIGIDLATINIVRGAIDPATLQPTGVVEPWLGGVPIVFGAYRQVARKDEQTTWRVNLDYQIFDDSMVYANVTTGYRSGGFNLAFFSQTPEYEPEELIAYEIGYKGQLLEDTLRINASAYFYDYSSIHIRTEEACPPVDDIQSAQSACAVTDSTTSIQAAPGAEVRGLELEAFWLATNALTLGGNVSYTDTEYTESFFVVDGADPRFPGAIYTPETNPDRVRDIKGNSLQHIPKYKGTLFGTYRFDLGSAGSLDLIANWSYIDDVDFSAFQDELDRAPAYDRLDLRATWASPSESFKISGFVNNVMDEIGIRQILRHGADDGYRRTAQVTEPRVYGLELSYTLR